MRRLCLLALTLFVPATAFAQPTLPPCKPKPVTYQDFWCLQIEKIVAKLKSQDLAKASDLQEFVEISGGNLVPFYLYAQARAKNLDLRAIEDARTDKQVGAPGNSPGSTSAVSKGAVPGILGFAVENGALTQSASGTAVTLRGNLVGWLDLIQKQGFIESYRDDSPFVRQLRRVSYSLTLNTDTTPTVDDSALSGVGGLTPDAIRDRIRETGRQLAGYSVRVALWDQRDPRADVNRAAVATTLDKEGVNAIRSDNFLDDMLTSADYLDKWHPQTAEMLNDRSLTARDVERILYRQLESLRLHMVIRITNFDEQVTKSLLAFQAFDKARLAVFQAMQKRPLVAFEYVNARSSGLPDKSTLRLIAESQFGSHLDLTGNIAWTMQRAGMVQLPEPTSLEGGMRDFQAAAQLEIPLGSIQNSLTSAAGIGTPVLGVAYLSQKLQDTAAVSFAGNTFTLEPGWIHVVQAKVTVPVKGSGVKIPLSISLANRTELIKGKNLRGHVGLTFDLDVLSALRR